MTDITIDNLIRDNVAYLLSKRKLTAEQAEEKMSLPSGTLAVFMDEGSLLDLADLVRISCFFDVTLDRLVKFDLDQENRKRQEEINRMKQLVLDTQERRLEWIETFHPSCFPTFMQPDVCFKCMDRDIGPLYLGSSKSGYILANMSNELPMLVTSSELKHLYEAVTDTINPKILN